MIRTLGVSQHQLILVSHSTNSFWCTTAPTHCQCSAHASTRIGFSLLLFIRCLQLKLWIGKAFACAGLILTPARSQNAFAAVDASTCTSARLKVQPVKDLAGEAVLQAYLWQCHVNDAPRSCPQTQVSCRTERTQQTQLSRFPNPEVHVASCSSAWDAPSMPRTDAS